MPLSGNALNLKNAISWWVANLQPMVDTASTLSSNCTAWGAINTKPKVDKLLGDLSANLAAMQAELHDLEDANASQP